MRVARFYLDWRQKESKCNSVHCRKNEGSLARLNPQYPHRPLSIRWRTRLLSYDCRSNRGLLPGTFRRLINEVNYIPNNKMNDNTAVWLTNNKEITRLRREASGLPDWNVNISITVASSVFLSGISSRNWLINWAVWIFTVASLREGLTERRSTGEWTTMGSHFLECALRLHKQMDVQSNLLIAVWQSHDDGAGLTDNFTGAYQHLFPQLSVIIQVLNVELFCLNLVLCEFNRNWYWTLRLVT